MEDRIISELTAKFSFLEGHIRKVRERRISADVATDRFEEVLVYAIHNTKFTILCTITGLDEGTTIGVIYHLAREDGIILNLKISVPRDNPVIKTVSYLFLCAEIYERELIDLLGVNVEGLGEGKRYPLPDNWPAGEYPLRKDWKPKTAKTEA